MEFKKSITVVTIAVTGKGVSVENFKLTNFPRRLNYKGEIFNLSLRNAVEHGGHVRSVGKTTGNQY